MEKKYLFLIVMGMILLFVLMSTEKETTFSVNTVNNGLRMIKVDVTLPLNEDEACEVAKAAATAFSSSREFECDEISRLSNTEIQVADVSIDENNFGTATVASINEKDRTINFYSSP
ncbi:MAG: hypothetical protein HYT16_03565 [DPANN group archaeon]|nr:hypothetical protein [DPANN group archaeon]